MLNPAGHHSDKIAVRVSGLSHAYGKNQALKNVSLELPSHTTIGLIGPDGVGKSTLLSLIAGIKIIQEGSVDVFGQDMADARVRDRLASRIAFMPQGLGHNLYPTLSIYENIDFHARLFGLKKAERKQRIQRLLDATSLTPFADRAASKLSGGMKQKLSLCCALVHSPDLLILDEPTTGVDPLSRRQFWALVEDLRAENPAMTVVVATAYIDEAERFEFLLAMDDGHLLAAKPTQQVIQETQSATLEEAYVKLLPEDKQSSEVGLEKRPFMPDPNEPYAMEAKGLSKRFGDFTAVDNVSFKIPRGEIFGFLGSNGCGKSTTMKMLTGLLEPTEGSAKLLGQEIDANDMATRMRVGYMSQAFSLYEELSVRENLLLHARLYKLQGAAISEAVERSLSDYDLVDVAESKPADLSLGIRQRLQLAAACLHHPEVLILDEPTSGVDPVARDMFWRRLLSLSRDDKITIFVSTHFMNEAQRCDRISFMHQGRVLGVGTPEELQARMQSPSLEEAFIAYLEEAEADELTQAARAGTEKGAGAKHLSHDQNAGISDSSYTNDSSDANHVPHEKDLSNAKHSSHKHDSSDTASRSAMQGSVGSHNVLISEPHKSTPSLGILYGLSMIWTFAIREGKELLRDHIRLFFAIFGPIFLMTSASIGVSFDVKDIRFAVLDRDKTIESRSLQEYYSGSRYFKFVGDLQSGAQIDEVLRSSKARVVIDIPPDFGVQVARGERPKVNFIIDGTVPFLASNIDGYLSGVLLQYAQDKLRSTGLPIDMSTPVDTVSRYVYNQDFQSIYAITPGMIMLAMMMIPAMMTALGVVREREIGSITNLYTSPASVTQFLIGKQLPYIALAMCSYLVMVWIAIVLLDVPLKGSFLAMTFGALGMVACSTAFGLLVSCFVRSQVAAIFAAAILAMIPALNYSGLLFPISTLTGASAIMAWAFPTSWYQLISIGAFTKGLGWTEFFNYFAVLFMICFMLVFVAGFFLKKQEV
ncbi:MAG: ribosome-associated ATPase/putative transporter RbbA [Pelistega sp.]|nr:ribosome-associated ATPase/putative transporter RbbA [Pelistega sp.]